MKKEMPQIRKKMKVRKHKQIAKYCTFAIEENNLSNLLYLNRVDEKCSQSAGPVDQRLDALEVNWISYTRIIFRRMFQLIECVYGFSRLLKKSLYLRNKDRIHPTGTSIGHVRCRNIAQFSVNIVYFANASRRCCDPSSKSSRSFKKKKPKHQIIPRLTSRSQGSALPIIC